MKLGSVLFAGLLLGLGLTVGAPRVLAAETPREINSGGALVCLESDGAEVAHFRVWLDSATGIVRLELLDAEADQPVATPQASIELQLYFDGDPTPEPLILSAQTDPSAGEATGDASVFEGQSDRLKGVTEFKASLASLFVAGYEVTDVQFSYPEGTHG